MADQRDRQGLEAKRGRLGAGGAGQEPGTRGGGEGLRSGESGASTGPLSIVARDHEDRSWKAATAMAGP